MTSVALRIREDNAENAETGRLFEEHSGQLLAYCSRQLGSRSEAEDAVQTTFLYALRALQRGVVPECEVAWLTTIAKNVCHWQRRTRDRRGPLASDIDLDTIGLAQPEGDEDGLLVGLKDALASIPENQRQALVLREWQGVPAREIASQLGMSRPATHALLTRARRSLAEALTVARKPVLGLSSLVFELRSHVKALLGGASTKAVVATVVVVGTTGVGGIAVERSLGSDAQAPRAPAAALDTSQLGTRARAPLSDIPRGETRPANLRQPGSRAPKGSLSETKAPSSAIDASAVAGDPPVSASPPAPVDRTEPETPAQVLRPLPDLPTDLPLEPPALPEVELPTALLPPLDPSLPPLPTEELPTEELPSLVPSLPEPSLP